jgi:cytochrome c oxidase assembly protein subunit 11
MFKNRLHPRFFKRFYANQQQDPRKYKIQTTMYYSASIAVTFVGLSFAAVPLYQLLCSTTGIDGTAQTGAGTKYLLDQIKPTKNAKPIKITFDSSVAETMPWKFVPETRQLTIVPGETALSFFKAKNPSDESIVGISTYSVVPYKAAQYFNKVQCFCFEEQRLEPGEEVDMPVFFFIDPEFSTDPWMKDVKEITLHYTFFKSKHQ